MENIIWTQLTAEQQDAIIRNLDAGVSIQFLAQQYNLLASSLERKWRYIKQNRRNGRELVRLSTSRSTQIIKANEEDETIDALPETNIFSAFKFPKFNGNIVGANESLPTDRFMYVETTEPITILFVTDTHFGQHDQQACDTFIRLAKKVPHDLIVHGGDALECYGLSRYGKDPNNIFKNSLKEERRHWREFNQKLNEASKAPKLIIAGNHIDRYFEWQKSNPTVMALEEFQLDNLLDLSNLGYQPMVNSIYFDAAQNTDYPDPNMVIHHGTVARRHAGSSSRAESENMGFVNSASGHTHRLSVAYKRTMRGQVIAIEGGTLRTLQPGWMSFPDWSHGAVLIEYSSKAKYITANPILFYNGEAYVNGTRI